MSHFKINGCKKIIKHFPQVTLKDDNMIRCLNFTSQYINLDDEIKTHNENRVKSVVTPLKRKGIAVDDDNNTQLRKRVKKTEDGRRKTEDGRRKTRNKRKSKKRSK